MGTPTQSTKMNELEALRKIIPLTIHLQISGILSIKDVCPENPKLCLDSLGHIELFFVHWILLHQF